MQFSNGVIVAILIVVIALIWAPFIAVFVNNRRRRNFEDIELNRMTPGSPTTMPHPILNTGGYQPGLAHGAPQHIRFANLEHPRRAAITEGRLFRTT